jgi:hypothetical protein
MPAGNPNWVPGHTSSSPGRPVGSRNRRTTELNDLLSKRGDRDPLEFSSQIVSDNSIPIETRLQAAALLAPYRHSKCGAMPPFRFILEPITLPHVHPTSPQEVDANIAHIIQAFASGNLDLDFYNALLAGQREYIVSFKAREEIDPANQDIHITGGLPSLPGCNITMPQLNGHGINGVLAAPAPVIEPTAEPQE